MHNESEGYYDETEAYRRKRQAELNMAAEDRAALERQYGQVWSTDELRAEFEVLGFMAPLVVVRRLSDNKKGSLEFQGSPRWYFNFVIDEEK
jgi:hypothetical protein